MKQDKETKTLNFTINSTHAKHNNNKKTIKQTYEFIRPNGAKIGKFDSWFIFDDIHITKQTDKSVFKHHGSGVPKGIRWYFEVENLTKEERLDIVLNYKETDYKAYISCESTLGRTRMFWFSDLHEKFNNYYETIDYYPILLFERIGKNQYKIDFEDSTSLLIEPLDDTHSYEEKNEHAKSMNILSLKHIAKKHGKKNPQEKSVTVKHINRDPYIAEYAKRRAKGICQLCNKAAPFIDQNGKPFLESHHIKWLKDGGEDTIENTVALCPNCHRKMHYDPDEKDIEILLEKAKNI